MRQITKAKNLLDCGFSIYGQGNFYLTLEEIAVVLRLVEKGDFKELSKLYDKLAKVRL